MKNVKSNPSLRVSEANAAIHESKIDGYFASLVKPADCYDLQSKSCNDDKNYKRFAVCFVWSLFVATLLGIALGFLLWLYDPFMFFHKPYFREWTYPSDRRLAAKGMVDFVEFDSAIFGSSLLENTLSKEADEKIGGKWLNLAVSSSRFYEREDLIKYTLQHKQQHKQIIYALENYFLVNGESRVNERTGFNPLNLNRSSFENFKILLNAQFVKCALLWSKRRQCVGGDLKNTYVTPYEKNKFGFTNWRNDEKEEFVRELELYENDNYQAVEFHSAEIQEYIKEHILFYVEQNPQINFHFILPTQSRFFWKIPYWWNDGKNFGTNTKRSPEQYYADWKVMIKWFIQESAKYPNVKIYGFDDLDYADSLDNYTDARHYNVDMNSMQIDAIANGTHILTPQNIDAYLATMESKIKNYDITPLIAEIKAWETKHKH